MRWDGGSISWSKIIRGAIASSITDSPSIGNIEVTPYRAAVLETDHNKLMDKIDSATTVLRKALLEASSPPEHIGERQRIEDALRTLDMIRRIELQIPA